jgi:hypothetical protein
MTKSNKQLTTELQPLKGQRQKGETDSAIVACNDWLRLGTGRTLPELAQKYGDMQPSATPTQSVSTLETWSSKFKWTERATEYDADYEAIKNAERQAVVSYGLALDYERIRRLKRLADMLEAQIYERSKDGVFHNIWVPDVKQIGSGDSAERVDIERFNAALISEYRSTLDDLAKEVGDRKQRTEIANAPGETLRHEFVNAPPIPISILGKLATDD